ncbi:hypothetical protein LQF76_04375 [Gloeomargaritales cyanobacterium VI4D9]|nr:hypothetical protein LQF76_04375 [Gloeomargaritales cyanobacterium VI4D9]
MKLISKTQNKVAELLTNSHTSSQLEISGNGSLQHQKNGAEDLLNQFQNVVDNNSFYETAELIFTEILDPKQLAQCAELACKREPGGAFYRAKLWARVSQIIEARREDDSNQLKLSQVCNQVGVGLTRAKGFVAQGQAIINVEEAGVETTILRKASPLLFQYAQRQRTGAKEYLIEAIKFLETNPEATHTQVHRNWCQKNGSIKANLDIIKPSDWWAFSHPKWRQEEDFPGSIPGEVYANALYYFAPQSGIAVDPMAGSGMLKRVYEDRDLWQKDSNFQLKIELFDLHPRRHFIKKHDAREPLPIKADWIFIDPPYYGQSSHLFTDQLACTDSYDSYLRVMKEIITALAESLNPKGRLCIFLPKWSGFRLEDPNHDIPSDVYSMAIACGLNWIDTAYVSRGRQQEPGSATKNNMAKRDRRMRSDTCVLNVFKKGGNDNV